MYMCAGVCVCVCERESYMNWGGLGCCLLSFLKSRGGLLALLPEIIKQMMLFARIFHTHQGKFSVGSLPPHDKEWPRRTLPSHRPWTDSSSVRARVCVCVYAYI